MYHSDYLRNLLSTRLAYWKKRAAGNAPEYRDWRKTAKGSIGYMVKPEGFSTGYNGEGRHRKPVYVAFSEQIPERDAHTVRQWRDGHTGWYTGTDCSDLAIGIIAKLNHGRWIAGYRLTMNDERVYFPDIHDSPEEAAQAADEHARIIGESEYEHSLKFDAMQELQSEISGMESELSREFALRNHPRFREVSRPICHDLIADIRAKRDILATEYKDMV